MNKALSKYGKARWDDIRLCRRAKTRKALRLNRAMLALAVGNINLMAIKCAPASTTESVIKKKIAIANCVRNTMKAVSKIMEDAK